VTTCLGWKTLEDLPVSTAVCWYSSLLYALLSICTAVQQNIALSRVNSYGDRDERICTFIGVKIKSLDGRAPPTWKPSRRLLLVWAIPVLLLDVSILLLLIGLGVMIFENAMKLGVYHLKVCTLSAI